MECLLPVEHDDLQRRMCPFFVPVVLVSLDERTFPLQQRGQRLGDVEQGGAWCRRICGTDELVTRKEIRLEQVDILDSMRWVGGTDLVSRIRIVVFRVEMSRQDQFRRCIWIKRCDQVRKRDVTYWRGRGERALPFPMSRSATAG